jgi:hypothetical protein
LSAALQRLQGRFILRLNDVPEMRALFAWATIETVKLSCDQRFSPMNPIIVGFGSHMSVASFQHVALIVSDRYLKLAIYSKHARKVLAANAMREHARFRTRSQKTNNGWLTKPAP